MDLSTVHHGAHKRKGKKRVARGPGSGHGKTGSRGSKGQWSQAGANMPPEIFEGGQMPLFRRIPKRGFSNATWAKCYLVVNVGDLDQAFADGATVDPASLRKVGLAKGDADVTKKLLVRAHHFSKSAAEKIAAKGGTTEIIPPRKKPVRNKMKPRPP